MHACNCSRSRRQFLKMAGAVSVGAAVGRGLAMATGAEAQDNAGASASQPDPVMHIGILLGTFGEPTLEAKLDAVKACGMDCVQVSMDCAGLSFMPETIPDAVADRIRTAAAARGIAVVGVAATFNMTHPDEEYRRTGLRQLGVLAAACKRMGTSNIHICTGTRDRENMWRRHPDNDTPESWRVMTGCVREAVRIAKDADVVLAFEPEVNNVVDSAKKSRRLMDEIGSPHLKVTMDGANVFHAGELAQMREVLEEAFALIGKDIVLAHAKDVSHDGDAGHEPAGHGKLDYDLYLSLLKGCGYRGPLLLHSLSEAQVPECVAFLRKKLDRLKT